MKVVCAVELLALDKWIPFLHCMFLKLLMKMSSRYNRE